MGENPFLSEKHPSSERWAIFEDDGRSGWLYLTKPGSDAPCADCWIYNRLRAPLPTQVQEFRGGPPPAVRGVTDDQALIADPLKSSMRFIWSADGHSVAFVHGDLVLGFIAEGAKRGYSRHVLKASPWGERWNQMLFERIFGAEKD